MLADQAFKKLIKEYKFKTVLDIGYGDGDHSRAFLRAGKTVTAIDYNPRREIDADDIEIINVDFNDFFGESKFDCIWCSHVLEHQFNPRKFLSKIAENVKVDGLVAITVPPMKHQIVGGHVTWWNAGKLLYMLILSGFDCSKARIKEYGYNISIIFKYKPIEDFDWNSLKFNKHDLKKLQPFFPITLNKLFFDGNIKELNWK